MSTPEKGPPSDDPWGAPSPADRASSAPPPGGLPPPPGAYVGQTGQPPSSGQPYGAPEQPPYAAPGQPPYGSPYGHPSAPPRNGIGTVALVLGIVGLVLSLFVIGALPGILAIIFGVIGLSRVRRRQATNRGAALTGVITGVLSLVVAIVVAVTVVSIFKTEFRKFRDCADNAQTVEQQRECRDLLRTNLDDRVNR